MNINDKESQRPPPRFATLQPFFRKFRYMYAKVEETIAYILYCISN